MVAWYLLLVGLGWLGLPLARRMFPDAVDGGYGVSRVLMLVVWGFIFWLPAVLGMVPSTIGWAISSLALAGGLSLWMGRGRYAELRTWVGGQRWQMISQEALFFVAFLLAAALRGAGPDAVSTEKPMELAFINAILSSPQFPPHDPWLSGYAISYYYFGYVLVALLAQLSQVSGSVAFNLAAAGWFAMAAQASFSLLYNLVNARWPGRRGNLTAALLAPLLILICGNLGGLAESLTSAGVFWKSAQTPIQADAFPPLPECLKGTPAMDSRFWRWLDVPEWNCPPREPLTPVPSRSNWWWWRSSRVLVDYTLNNAPKEIIDEFPAFSFTLGDLHPHVLSIPLALLALALAWQRAGRVSRDRPDHSSWKSLIREPGGWLEALVLGALAFNNIWDFPIYLMILMMVHFFTDSQSCGGWSWSVLRLTVERGFLLALGAVLLYLPFFLGFSSQAGGFLPSLSYFTRGAQLWVMFAPLWLSLTGWLLLRAVHKLDRGVFLTAGGLSLALTASLWLLSYALGGIILQIPAVSSLFLGAQGLTPDQSGRLLAESALRRLVYPGGWLTLTMLVFLILTGLIRQIRQSKKAHLESLPDGFALVLALAGTGLVLVPEFFYLRDQFGWRMNTIFKFYYQAWILFALAGGYGLVALMRSGKLVWLARTAALLGWIGILGGLAYPAFAYGERLSVSMLRGSAWTLDAADYLQRNEADAWGAVEWLRAATPGVLAEAVGGSYDPGFARYATHSGQSAVLGWPGHESQWRGGYSEMGNRQADIEQLYQTRNWQTAREIIDRYGIRYIVVGPYERSAYGQRLDEKKFIANLTLVYDSLTVRIFQTESEPAIR